VSAKRATNSLVIAGLDPAIRLFRKMMDLRVEARG